jgi:hypothetical protein
LSVAHETAGLDALERIRSWVFNIKAPLPPEKKNGLEG